MCGVFGYIGKSNNASQIVFEGIKALEYRGYDSWGEAIWPRDRGSNLIIVRKIGKISGNAPQVASHLALGHTRWATHGGVTVQNSHPHLDCTGRFALIHNGIIENFDQLKPTLISQNHKFSSQTDTEVAVHLIEEILKKEKDFFRGFVKAFRQLEGLNALVAIDKTSQKIYAVKIGSPLVVGFGQNENFLASDVSAIIPYTKKVHFLEDNQGAIISQDNIRIINLKNLKEILIKPINIPWEKELTSQGKFKHFMLKEIYEQPKILSNILENNLTQIEALGELIKKSYGTYIIGCGTASYACIFGQYLLSKISKRHVNFSVGSEFGYLVDFLKKNSLIIALSQSGETIDILESVDKAKEKGAKIAALVNVLGSTLYRKADFKLLLMAGPEKAVASTKAFVAKITNLILLSYYLNGGIKQARDLIGKAINESLRILKDLSIIKKLAKKIAKKEHIFLIGRGLSYPIALEATMKIKEISYIHAEGFAAGELKHGVIALIEKDTPCIIFAPNDETYGAVISGAMELKARGGYIIGISFKDRSDIFDYYIPVKDLGVATAIPEIIISQLLAYYLGINRKCEIDKPRNLAKSVTVK